MNRFEWTTARSIGEAVGSASTTVADAMVSAAGEPHTDAAVFKAGGIDLLDLMKERLVTPRRVINLRTIPELGRIDEQDDGALRIGANVTLAQLGSDPVVRERYRAVADAAAGSASPQIRQVATAGGNLLQRPRCWYFRSSEHHCVRKGGNSCFVFAGENQYHAIFDHNGCAMVHPSTIATALVAFGASVVLIDAKMTPRVVRLEDFLLLPETDVEHENDLRPGELLTAIMLPAPAPGSSSVHLCLAEKESFDWPIADVAVVLDLDAARVCRAAAIVLGASAPVPHRAKAAEATLVGKHIDEDAARAAGREALTGAAPLTRNAYKLPIFETLVRRAILAANGNA
jgi:xanthine dehydrogenase YagS FAD-binding subunit